MAKGKPAAPRRRSEASLKTQTERANARALALAPIIAEIQAHGITRPHAIAAALTDRGVRTALGRRFWVGLQVRDILDRLDRLGHLKSASAQGSTSPRPERSAKPLIDNGGTILSNMAGEIITFSQARRRGRPTAREIVGQILTQLRTEGAALHESHGLLAKTVAARYGGDLGDRSWGEAAIRNHVSKWLRENPDPNDYRVALTLKEAARESGVKRSLLDIAISRGTLRAHKCTARTMILQSDLQRFIAEFFGGHTDRTLGPWPI